VHCRYPHGSPHHNVSSPEPPGIVSPPLLAPSPQVLAPNPGMIMSGDVVQTTRHQIQPQILPSHVPQHLPQQQIQQISQIHHIFPSQPLARLPSPPRPAPIPQETLPPPKHITNHSPQPYRQPLNVTDLELLHHYNISTSYTLANDSGLQTCLRINVPQIGVSYPFVLHGILALAALHLSRFKQGTQKAHYISEAQHHCETALDEATRLMPHITSETCAPLYLFTTFCLYITLGLGPRPGDFLLFGEDGSPEWLVMHKGMKSIIHSCWEPLRNGDLAPLFQLQAQITNQGPQDNPHIDILRDLIIACNDPNTQLYLATLTLLARSFPSSPPANYAAQPSPHVVFAWIHRLDDEFVQKLKERESIALVLLAHFCVLLNSLSSFWWTRGWVEHLMGEIYGSLRKEFRLWIKWPMEEIGWIPS
jgi:hypothetical protein